MSAHKVTARDVAERAGVSRSPVSMYRNRNPKAWISEAAKRRIDDAVRELQYRPNRAAQLLTDSGSYGEREFLALPEGRGAGMRFHSFRLRYRVAAGDGDRRRTAVVSAGRIDLFCRNRRRNSPGTAGRCPVLERLLVSAVCVSCPVRWIDRTGGSGVCRASGGSSS